jgi:hypothetical protein
MQTERPLYDVALSFASEDRAVAAALAESLRAKGVRVFYDAFEPGALWGKDLSDHLRSVYNGSRVCVLLLSNAYTSKPWAMFESRAAMARAAQDDSIVVLPVRLDASKLPPPFTTIAALDARHHDIAEIAELIEKRVDLARDGTGREAVAADRPDYHVISRTDGWVVKAANAERGSRVMKTQAEAIHFARDLARRHSANEVIVHKEDGSVKRRLSTRS